MRDLARKTALMAIAIVLAHAATAAQEEAPGPDGSSFEVLVYVLGDAPAGAKAPSEIKGAVSEIRDRTGRDASVLTWTMMHIGSGGSARIGTVKEKIGGMPAGDRPVFTELAVGPLRPLASGQERIELARFESSWRVPVMIGGAPNYETVKYASNRVLLRIGEATLIGNLTLPAGGGDLYFVLLAKRTN